MDSERIRREATEWFVALHEDPALPGPRAEFEAWRAADLRHAASYDRLQRLWGAAAHVPGTGRAPPAVTRRRVLRGSAVALASAAGVVGAGRLALGPHPFADHATRIGERRTIALPDGSFAELSTATAVNIKYGPAERLVEMISGEAFFNVAPDPARPFRVAAGGGTATALGTAFSVAADHGGARLTVTEHAVLVRGGTDTLPVVQGQSVRFGSSGVGQLEPADSTALAWREGRLAFVSRPLGEVVDALNRWSQGRIIVADEDLARRPVTLMIGTDQASRAIEQISAVIPMRIMRLTDLVTIIRAMN